MARKIKVAAAQVGAIHLTTERSETLTRLLALLDSAISQRAKLILFPEITLTTFFPRHLFTTNLAELESFFEHGDIVTSPNAKPLFDRAGEANVDICLGFAERAGGGGDDDDDDDGGKGFNTCVYFSGAERRVIAKYRKVHLPGTKEPFPDPNAINQFEKRYFEPGNLGFKAFRAPGLIEGAVKKKREKEKENVGEESTVGKGDPIIGMLICNDRRWPEAWRAYGLQGVELVLCGYNTGCWDPEYWSKQGLTKPDLAKTMGEPEEDALYHHKLAMESNSYMNSCFSIGAARAGWDDGKFGLIGGSGIHGPQGRTLKDTLGNEDELIVCEIDLEDCRRGKEKTFAFENHRRTEAYGIIVNQTGVKEPELLD